MVKIDNSIIENAIMMMILFIVIIIIWKVNLIGNVNSHAFDIVLYGDYPINYLRES